MRISRRTISAADRYCDTVLAMATPATLSWHTITKNRFSITFTMPATIIMISGRRVSPAALSTALPKLYTASAGIPKKYIWRYCIAPSISSSFVPNSCIIGRAPSTPISSAIVPIITHKIADVCTVSLTSRSL